MGGAPVVPLFRTGPVRWFGQGSTATIGYCENSLGVVKIDIPLLITIFQFIRSLASYLSGTEDSASFPSTITRGKDPHVRSLWKLATAINLRVYKPCATIHKPGHEQA